MEERDWETAVEKGCRYEEDEEPAPVPEPGPPPVLLPPLALVALVPLASRRRRDDMAGRGTWLAGLTEGDADENERRE